MRQPNLIVALILLLCGGAWSSTDNTRETGKENNYTYYYVSSVAGDDANDGLSPEKAWKTLDKVNAHLFQPNDVILFCSDNEWEGQLRPQGSGAEGKPILIDRYGEGALPKIDQEDRGGAVLQLENQEYWEITHLELTASGSIDDYDRDKAYASGIRVIATTADHVLKHIVIRECIVRNVFGRMKVYEGGIWIGVPGDWRKEWNWQNREYPHHHPPTFTTAFDGVLIENNRIYSVDRFGILVWASANPGNHPNSYYLEGLLPNKNVIVRNNVLEDIGGDAIMVQGCDSPLIEKNTVRRSCKKSGDKRLKDPRGKFWAPHAAAIWLCYCYKGVIQYNDVYDTYRLEHNNDGTSYDFDLCSVDCLIQYNYSRNNAGGFILVMPDAVNCAARYNISENDRGNLLFLPGRMSDNNLIYNNTFYMSTGHISIGDNATMYNNIFMRTGDAQIELNQVNPGSFQQNCYFGWSSYPDDTFKIIDDPQFQDPGNGGENAKNLSCYALNENSPCRSRGKIITNNGGLDILGNPIPLSDRPDLGAIQH
jgi:hypothetical protein